jgi:hypothetical protein
MKISPSKKAKLKAAFNPDLHPRYPAGHPLGGKFMPKGSADYKAAITAQSKTSWQEVTGKDFRKHFKQWDEHAEKMYGFIANHNESEKLKSAIADHQSKIERDKQSIKKFKAQSGDENKHNIKLREDAIAYRQFEINKHQKRLDAIDPTVPKTPISQLKDSKMLYEIFVSNMQGRSLVGVKDGNEMGAAAAIIPKKDHIYIDFLMTNPKSLIEGKSKGAGTAAIKAVAKRSMESGKDGRVKLWAVDSAVPFYEKVGFIRDEPDDNSMTLSPQAAKKLLGI